MARYMILSGGEHAWCGGEGYGKATSDVDHTCAKHSAVVDGTTVDGTVSRKNGKKHKMLAKEHDEERIGRLFQKMRKKMIKLSGYVPIYFWILCFFYDNLLTWSSKRQETLSCSSAEAEYHRVVNVVAETSWIHNLLRELHTPLFTATYMPANSVQHQRTKHIKIDIHFIRDKVAAGHVRVLHVPSRFQYADIFTKSLPYLLFADFRSGLSNLDEWVMNVKRELSGKKWKLVFCVFLIPLAMVISMAGFEVKEVMDGFQYHNLYEKQKFFNFCFADGLLLFTRGNVISASVVMCHVLLVKPWRREVNGAYNIHINLYSFSQGKIVAVSPKVKPKEPKVDIMTEENMLKVRVIEERMDNIKGFYECDDNFLNLISEVPREITRFEVSMFTSQDYLGNKVLEVFLQGGVHGLHDGKSVWFEVELHGAQGNRETEDFQVSNDDVAVAYRRLQDKQLEEKTNMDCLVNKQ
nr:ribonuclease H-like domain-containing protein [Tanacetum cinerariifolium]